VKVTVKDVKDLSGNPISPQGNSAVYTEVTTWKYVLGFGLPALLAAMLGIGWFSKDAWPIVPVVFSIRTPTCLRLPGRRPETNFSPPCPAASHSGIERRSHP
jgi:hypothetical protein